MSAHEMTEGLQVVPSRRKAGWCCCRLLGRVKRTVTNAVVRPVDTSLEVLGTIYFFNVGLLDGALGALYCAVDGIASLCTDQDNSSSELNLLPDACFGPCTCKNEVDSKTQTDQLSIKLCSCTTSRLSDGHSSYFDLESQRLVEAGVPMHTETAGDEREHVAGVTTCACSILHCQGSASGGGCLLLEQKRTGIRDAAKLTTSKYGKSRWRLFVHTAEFDRLDGSQWTPASMAMSSSTVSLLTNFDSCSSGAAYVINVADCRVKSATMVPRTRSFREQIHNLLKRFDLHLDFVSDTHLTPYSELSRHLSCRPMPSSCPEAKWSGEELSVTTEAYSVPVPITEKTAALQQPCQPEYQGNIIFIHGVASSSNFWRDTILPNLSNDTRASFRIFCPDLLGLGRSPRPKLCTYTVDEQVEAIYHSVIEANRLETYHLIGHSMGCKIALALAASNPAALCSLTLLAPANWELGGEDTLMKLAPRKLLPLHTILFSSTWYYPNVARLLSAVQFPTGLKFILRQLLPARYPTSLINDFVEAQAPFHVVWNIFWNTLVQHKFGPDMEVLQAAGKRIRIIHGMDDPLCPFQCSMELAEKYSVVSLLGVPAGSHELILGREIPITREIEKEVWRGALSWKRLNLRVKSLDSQASPGMASESVAAGESPIEPGSPPLPLSYCVQR